MMSANSQLEDNKWKKEQIGLLEPKTSTMASTADINKLYEMSVQSPSREVTNLLMMHHHVHGDEKRYVIPTTLREDFCGTALLCKSWLERNVMHQALGIDWDASVLEYSRRVHFSGFVDDRISLHCANVLDHDPNYPQADIIASLNYGICYFHTRRSLLNYLSNVLHNNYLKFGGIFVCDLFGGTEYHNLDQPLIQTVRNISNFRYTFEQKTLDQLTNRVHCSMHFRFKDGSVIKNAFQYDFRMWSLCELKELFIDAGFSRVYVWLMGRERRHAVESDQNLDSLCDDDQNGKIMKSIQLHPVKTETRECIDATLYRSWNAYIVGTRE